MIKHRNIFFGLLFFIFCAQLYKHSSLNAAASQKLTESSQIVTIKDINCLREEHVPSILEKILYKNGAAKKILRKRTFIEAVQKNLFIDWVLYSGIINDWYSKALSEKKPGATELINSIDWITLQEGSLFLELPTNKKPIEKKESLINNDPSNNGSQALEEIYFFKNAFDEPIFRSILTRHILTLLELNISNKSAKEIESSAAQIHATFMNTCEEIIKNSDQHSNEQLRLKIETLSTYLINSTLHNLSWHAYSKRKIITKTAFAVTTALITGGLIKIGRYFLSSDLEAERIRLATEQSIKTEAARKEFEAKLKILKEENEATTIALLKTERIKNEEDAALKSAQNLKQSIEDFIKENKDDKTKLEEKKLLLSEGKREIKEKLEIEKAKEINEMYQKHIALIEEAIELLTPEIDRLLKVEEALALTTTLATEREKWKTSISAEIDQLIAKESVTTEELTSKKTELTTNKTAFEHDKHDKSAEIVADLDQRILSSDQLIQKLNDKIDEITRVKAEAAVQVKSEEDANTAAAAKAAEDAQTAEEALEQVRNSKNKNEVALADLIQTLSTLLDELGSECASQVQKINDFLATANIIKGDLKTGWTQIRPVAEQLIVDLAQIPAVGVAGGAMILVDNALKVLIETAKLKCIESKIPEIVTHSAEAFSAHLNPTKLNIENQIFCQSVALFGADHSLPIVAANAVAQTVIDQAIASNIIPECITNLVKPETIKTGIHNMLDVGTTYAIMPNHPLGLLAAIYSGQTHAAKNPEINPIILSGIAGMAYLMMQNNTLGGITAALAAAPFFAKCSSSISTYLPEGTNSVIAGGLGGLYYGQATYQIASSFIPDEYALGLGAIAFFAHIGLNQTERGQEAKQWLNDQKTELYAKSATLGVKHGPIIYNAAQAVYNNPQENLIKPLAEITIKHQKDEAQLFQNTAQAIVAGTFNCIAGTFNCIKDPVGTARSTYNGILHPIDTWNWFFSQTEADQAPE